MCFYQVKCDGKSKWDPPNVKTSLGLWDLGAEPKGKLEFSFTCEPFEYKKEVAKLAKEAQALAAENPTTPIDPAKLIPPKKQLMNEQSISRQVAS